MKGLDLENVWKIVKETRKSFLFEAKESLSACQFNSNPLLLSPKVIQENHNKVEKELGMNAETTSYENVSERTLETAAEMFTYLNQCPQEHKLLSFYKDLFKSASPKDIILALTSIMKTTNNLEKEKSVNIFRKVMESINLLNYEDLQIIIKGNCYNANGTFNNCSNKKNLINKKILNFSGLF